MRRRRLHLLRDGAARDPGREPGAAAGEAGRRRAPGSRRETGGPRDHGSGPAAGSGRVPRLLRTDRGLARRRAPGRGSTWRPGAAEPAAPLGASPRLKSGSFGEDGVGLGTRAAFPSSWCRLLFAPICRNFSSS